MALRVQYFTNQINFTQPEIHFMQLRITFLNFHLSGTYFCYYQKPVVTRLQKTNILLISNVETLVSCG